jgi:hypothetical protein
MKVFGPKWDKVTGDWRLQAIAQREASWFALLTKYYSGNEIRNKIGGACTYVGE